MLWDFTIACCIYYNLSPLLNKMCIFSLRVHGAVYDLRVSHLRDLHRFDHEAAVAQQ